MSSIGTKVICPFYISHTDKSITCEGLEKNTVITTRFKVRLLLTKHLCSKCESQSYAYKCLLADALADKYEE